MSRIWTGSFGGSDRCRRAQALVNSLLGSKAPKVYYYGNQFTHFAEWADRKLISLVAAWAAKNPGKRPERAQVLEWHRELSARVPNSQNAIVLGVFPPESTPKIEAALDGAALHEAFHGLYSRQTPLTTEEIGDLIVANWSSIPDWHAFANFLLEAHNAAEDVRCEKKGMQDYPGSRGVLEALADFCLQSPGRQRLAGMSQMRALLVCLNLLGHTISTPLISRYLDDAREAHPEILREIEEGKYKPILDAIREMPLEDDLAAMRIAIQLAAILAKEGFCQAMGSPLDSCPACGAPREKMWGVLLPRSDRSNPCRVLILTCEVCGHSEQAEVVPRDPGNPESSGPQKIPVFDLEAVQDARGAQEGEGKGLPGQAVDTAPGTYPSAEEAMQEASSKTWEQKTARVPAGTGKTAPYRPYNPGADSVFTPPKNDHLLQKALQMRAEVYKEICAIRVGLRRLVRSVQPSRTRDVNDGPDLSERRLLETMISIDNDQFPERAFSITSHHPLPSAAAVFVIDLSTSMKSWVREAGKLMLAGASAFEDVRFACACFGFRDGPKDDAPLPKRGQTSGYHRTEAVQIVVFKSFHERIGPNLTRFPQVEAHGSTPMADGLQAGIEALLTREEKLRMLFLISDGEPNTGTEATIRSQILEGQNRGLYFCGTGIGEGSKKILSLIPNSIHVNDIQEVPPVLLNRVAHLVAGQIRRSRA